MGAEGDREPSRRDGESTKPLTTSSRRFDPELNWLFYPCPSLPRGVRLPAYGTRTAIEYSVEGVHARMLVFPGPTLVTTPSAVTVATRGSPEAKVVLLDFVSSSEEPSAKAPSSRTGI